MSGVRRALVTGASGFVGGHLCERLRAEGWEVRALVREGSSRGVLESSGCELVSAGLEDRDVIVRALDGCEALFHVAGRTQSPTAEGFDAVNRGGTASVVAAADAARFDGVFCLVSSLAAGGPSPDGVRPRTEADGDAPISDYGRSKLGGEVELRARKGPYRFVIVRPGAIYGVRERGILTVFQAVARHGVAMRVGDGLRLQMTDVEDVIEGVMRTLPQATATGEVYYLVQETLWHVDDVAREAARQLGRRLSVIPVPMFAAVAVGHLTDLAGRIAGRALSPVGRDKVREMTVSAWYASTAKLEAEAGWKPAIAFPEGLARTLDWARKTGRI